MKRYYATNAYASHFEPTHVFAEIEDVRAFDRGFAAAYIGRLATYDVSKAFEGDRAEEMRGVIAFLQDELPYMDAKGAA